MKLDYGTQISPAPIRLSVGTLKKPKLLEISELNFDAFDIYEMFLKLTPEIFYTKLKGNDGKAYWESLSDEQRENITLYDLILNDESLQKTYQEILDFFFVEIVVYDNGLFFILKNRTDKMADITQDDICGIIHKELFPEILDLIQQICCISNKKESSENVKFKNNIAKKLYDKMQKAQQKQEKRKKKDINLTIPNIISSVSVKHQSLNYSNIWDLTIFQLLDNFNRLQVNAMYDIDALRVSVWGDEKKTFNAALWYKNHYEAKN